MGRPAFGIMRSLAMLALLLNLLSTLLSVLRTRAELALENLALRQQLATLRRSSPRPRLRLTDRAFWIGLSQVWFRWADALVIVKPDTVVRWDRTFMMRLLSRNGCSSLRSRHGRGYREASQGVWW
jgi:hypothetical protein